MMDQQLVLYEEDHRKILTVIGRLVREANAKGIFVVDKNGQLIAEAGEVRGIDSTSLASLTAGSIAATGGLAKIIGEEDFPVHFHQGQRDNLHITMVDRRVILVVVLDDRSSLGLVRLRVKKAGAELARVFSGFFAWDGLEASNLPSELQGDPRLRGSDKADHAEQLAEYGFELDAARS